MGITFQFYFREHMKSRLSLGIVVN